MDSKPNHGQYHHSRDTPQLKLWTAAKASTSLTIPSYFVCMFAGYASSGATEQQDVSAERYASSYWSCMQHMYNMMLRISSHT